MKRGTNEEDKEDDEVSPETGWPLFIFGQDHFTSEESSLFQEYVKLENQQYAIAQKFTDYIKNRFIIFPNTTFKELWANKELKVKIGLKTKQEIMYADLKKL